MIYYKLTCIKDMPDVEKGFSYSFLEDDLNPSGAVLFSNDKKEDFKIHTLLQYKDYPEFVQKEVDLSKAITELKCPYCNKESLFNFVDSELKYHYSGDDVNKWYQNSGVVCGICGWKKDLNSTCVKSKIDW